MLESLGPFYYFVLLLELIIWGSLIVMGYLKFARARRDRSTGPGHVVGA
jgi:hypothetical protein